MRWTHLGHAMWLVEAAGLRLLFDPLLDATHHGGVFEVVPQRRVDAEALAPDFVFVSHRHTDHFDLPSLRRLAALDADAVVVTPDPLVERAARRLGFHTVHRVEAPSKIELDGVRLVLTSSTEPLEWGAMVETADGVVWNQVDSVQETAAAVVAVVDEGRAALGRADPLSLAIVRWQPMLEIALQTASDPGFPARYYRDNLEQIAAVGARAVVPGACGARHVGPHAFMDRLVYPVSEARLLRDLARRLPATALFPATVGGLYTVEAGVVHHDPAGGAALVRLEPMPETRTYCPLDAPAIVDANPRALPVGPMRERVERWVREVLAPALGAVPAARGLSLVLEITWPDARDAYTLRDGALTRHFDPEWDALDQVAGSYLCDVLDGVRNWGDVLLGGMLRGALRAYDVDEQGLRPRALAVMFVYYALSYDEAFERWLDRALENGHVGGGRD